MRKKKLAVVGNGMGTCRLLDELVLRGGHGQYDITVFGEETGGRLQPHFARSRPRRRGARQHRDQTSGVVRPARHSPPREHESDSPRPFQQERRDRLWPESSLRRCRARDRQPAAGPGIAISLEGMMAEDGELRPGVFVYRTLTDCLRMREFARSGNSAIVVEEGGLLGLEAAKVLSDRGLHVTVVHVAQTLMNAQLDALGGEMLRRQIERCGIFVRTGKTVEALYGCTATSRCRRRVSRRRSDVAGGHGGAGVRRTPARRSRTSFRASRQQGDHRQRHTGDGGAQRLRVWRMR